MSDDISPVPAEREVNWSRPVSSIHSLPSLPAEATREDLWSEVCRLRSELQQARDERDAMALKMRREVDTIRVVAGDLRDDLRHFAASAGESFQAIVRSVLHRPQGAVLHVARRNLTADLHELKGDVVALQRELAEWFDGSAWLKGGRSDAHLIQELHRRIAALCQLNLQARRMLHQKHDYTTTAPISWNLTGSKLTDVMPHVFAALDACHQDQSVAVEKTRLMSLRLTAAEAQAQQFASELRALKQCVVESVERHDRQGLITAPPNIGLKPSEWLDHSSDVSKQTASAADSFSTAVLMVPPSVGVNSSTEEVMELLRRRSAMMTPKPPSLLQAATTKAIAARPLQVSVIRAPQESGEGDVGRLVALNASLRKQQARLRFRLLALRVQNELTKFRCRRVLAIGNLHYRLLRKKFLEQRAYLIEVTTPVPRPATTLATTTLHLSKRPAVGMDGPELTQSWSSTLPPHPHLHHHLPLPVRSAQTKLHIVTSSSTTRIAATPPSSSSSRKERQSFQSYVQTVRSSSSNTTNPQSSSAALLVASSSPSPLLPRAAIGTTAATTVVTSPRRHSMRPSVPSNLLRPSPTKASAAKSQ